MEWNEDGKPKVVRIFEKSMNQWRMIGENLGLDNSVLESIAVDSRDNRERVTKVLGKWQENAVGLPHGDKYPKTWGGLINLLNDSDHAELAREVHKALLQQKQPGEQHFIISTCKKYIIHSIWLCRALSS